MTRCSFSNKSRMIIWIINHYSAPLSNSAGSSRTYDIAEGLVKLGCKVRVFSANNHEGLIDKVPLDNLSREEIVKDSFTHHYVRTRNGKNGNFGKLCSMISFRNNVIKLGKSIEEHPDFVIGSSVHPFAWDAAMKLATIKKSKFIAEVRDIWPLTFVNSGRMSKWNPFVFYLSSLEKRAYRNAGFVIHLMESNGYFESKGARKLLFLPNGINIRRFDELTNIENSEISEIVRKIRKKYRTLIGYAGRLSEIYNPTNIIEAAEIASRQINDIAFIIAGSGPLLEECKRIVGEKHLENIVFLGRIKKSSIPFFLKQMDALLVHVRNLPIQEKFGVSYNKLFEYCAAERPIIYVASFREGIEKQMGKEAIVFAEPDNLDSFIGAIYSLDRNLPALVSNSHKLRYYVEMNHDTDFLSEKLFLALENVLSNQIEKGLLRN